MPITSRDIEIKPVLDNYCKYCGTLLAVPKMFCFMCGKKVSNDLDEILINFCRYCGSKISRSDKFCMKCGKRIN
ncbi:MAG: zinc-ribbon domain-containing protein [Promethearchaeota archaeon]